MSRMKHLLLLAAFALWSALATAQTRTVSGTIRDAAGQPLPGVAIVVPGTTHGTVTDLDGHYTITVDGAQKLTASFIGYLSSDIDLAAGQTDATLQEENKEMDEVIVVAYGTSTKGTYTGSAAQVGAEKLEKRQVSNASQALTGTMAGVQTLSADGQPGTSATIRVRGAGSINAEMDPLIIVDGMPFDGDLSSINTNDIESMTVLKDAASTALYGARGANGIIMITTKKGKKGDAKINFEARWGVNTRQVENYDVLKSAGEYMEKLYTAYYNAYVYNEELDKDVAHVYANSAIMGGGGADGKTTGIGEGYQIFTVPDGETLVGADGKLNPNAKLGYSDGKYYYTPDDWEEETFKRQNRQQYDLSIAGGTDNFNYFFSLGYINDGGVIPNSAFERLSTRLKVDYQAKKWLKVGANAAYSHSKSRKPGEQQSINSTGNAFFIANFIAPVYPLYVRNADGSDMYDNGRRVYDYGDGKSSNGNRQWMSIANPLGDLTYNKEVYQHDIFNGGLSADITPIKGLTLTAKYGIYVDNERGDMLSNAYMGQSAAYHGGASQEANRDYALDQQYIGNYNFTVNDVNSFDITVGYDGYHLRMTSLSGYGTELYNPESFFLSNATKNFSISGSQDEYSTAGYFARFNYGYAEKYFANVSYRRDSSSRFSEDNRWGDFWSASAAWLISKESFLEGVKWIDMLKVKASYGEQGNDNIGNYYAYEDQYKMTGANGSFSDATLTWKGNPDLTWETSKSWNAGVDFAFLGNKIVGSAEYFGRKSDDMLYNKPVATSLGYSTYPMNVGSMTNSGVEVDLNVNVLKFSKFNWDVNVNGTFIRNEINKLHPDLGGKMIDGSRIYEEGKSMYRYYMVDWAGVDEKTGKALYWTEENGERVKTEDYNDAQLHKVCTADLMPKVYGGFGTSLEFFGFDASAAFSYQLGGKIWDYGYQDLMHGGSSSNVGLNWHEDICNAWTPENTQTDVPRLDNEDNYANSSSTRWICSSNYLALNNVTLGYTIPADITRKAFLETVRVYFAADNVALWSYRKGLDPRQSFTYATTARYTAIRSISGGVKITF